MLLKLLKKYNIDNYFFMYYENKELGNICSLVVVQDDAIADYIDIFNKQMISCFGNLYKVPLTKYPRPYNKNKISPREAKKWAKEYFEEYKKYVAEQEELEHPNRFKFKDSADNNNTKRPPDIIIE